MNELLTAPVSQLQRQVERENRILLTGVRWETYKALADDVGERPLRLTYDNGNLEIMTLSLTHEFYKTLLARLFELLTFTLHIPIKSLGSTTLRPEHLKKGLEPDECYYVLNEARVRGKMEIDLESDPPPDLAIEVDISRSSINRLGIYAALRVLEVWRFDGQALFIHQLQADGSYALADHSVNLPSFPLQEMVRFLQPNEKIDETSLMWSFVEWVRERSGT